MNTTFRLSKKCALSNYSEDHKFETFDISMEVTLDGNITDEITQSTFADLRRRVHEQEHDTILFFLENAHTEESTDVVVKQTNENEDANGELII